MEQNTTAVETITHHHIIHIFLGHKAQLINIEMAKAVVALNPQSFQHINLQKEKDYYKTYMHVNRNILAEYEKMKRLNKSEQRSMSVRVYGEGLPHQQMLREAKI